MKQWRVYNTIFDIKDIWEKLYSNNKLMTPFQSFEWNSLIEQKIELEKKRILFRKSNYVVKYYVLDSAVIMPLCIEHSKKMVHILGYNESSDYLSFIFKKIDAEILLVCLNKIRAEYPVFQIILNRINEKNPMQQLLNQTKNTQAQRSICVGINIPTKNEDYYKTLDKHVRQNYRTSLNKIKKDGLVYECCYEEKIIEQYAANRLFHLYIKRRRDTIDSRLLWFLVMMKAILKKIFMVKDMDILTSYSTLHRVFIATIFIKEQVAAFYEGPIGNDGTIYIARVATNPEFYKYQPGMLLLIKTIEAIKGEYAYLDLTRGNEIYKHRAGGIVHYNYCYHFL